MNIIKKVDSKKVLVTIILAVSVFVFQYHSDAEIMDMKEAMDADTLQYAYELTFATAQPDFTMDLFYNMPMKECTISIIDLSLYMDDFGSSYMADIIISGEDFLFPLYTGSYPTEERLATGKPCAVLGRKLYQYTYKRDNIRYIRICGDEYEVTGFVSAKNSSIYNHRIILFSKCLGEGARKDIYYFRDSRGLVLKACSNFITEDEMMEYFKSYVDVPDYGISKLYEYRRFLETSSVDEQYRTYASIIYVFSILMVVLIVNLWMLEHKREYAVKKAFGFSNMKLIAEFAKELIAMLGVAIVLAEGCVLMMAVIEKELILFNEERFMEILICLSNYILRTLPILLIVPLVILVKDNPIKMLVDKDV